MGYKIEPRIVSCVYNNYAYVGDGLIARWFVLDEDTGKVLANNRGKGYKTYEKALLAYHWHLKGPPAIKVQQEEQEMLYEWSLKNKLITDRLDRIAIHYEKEKRPLTPKHIKILFETQKATCPTDEEKFLVAYQHDFYEDVVLERRAKRKKQKARQEKWDVKKKLDSSAAVQKFVDGTDVVAVMLAPVGAMFNNMLKDYNDRPECADPKDKAIKMHYVSPIEIVSTGQPFQGHQWDVVEKDPNIHPIYDTFGQEGPSSVNRVMDRQYVPYHNPQKDKHVSLALDMMVDPVSHQIVHRRTTRCLSADEWNQMANGYKKKRPKPTAPPPVATEEWVEVPEEPAVARPEIPKVSKSKPKIEPEQVSTSMSLGGTKKKRPRPKELPEKKEPPKKTSVMDKMRSKFEEFKKDWTEGDDEEYDDDLEYEIPTAKEVFSNLKSSIGSFFSGTKSEPEQTKNHQENKKIEKSQSQEKTQPTKSDVKMEQSVVGEPTVKAPSIVNAETINNTEVNDTPVPPIKNSAKIKVTPKSAAISSDTDDFLNSVLPDIQDTPGNPTGFSDADLDDLDISMAIGSDNSTVISDEELDKLLHMDF